GGTVDHLPPASPVLRFCNPSFPKARGPVKALFYELHLRLPICGTHSAKDEGLTAAGRQDEFGNGVLRFRFQSSGGVELHGATAGRGREAGATPGDLHAVRRSAVVESRAATHSEADVAA